MLRGLLGGPGLHLKLLLCLALSWGWFSEEERPAWGSKELLSSRPSQAHKNCGSMSEIEAKVRYVKLARSLKTYGVSFFLVKVRHLQPLACPGHCCRLRVPSAWWRCSALGGPLLGQGWAFKGRLVTPCPWCLAPQEKMKGKNKLVPRLLGITKECVMRVDEKTKEVIQEWNLTNIKRWAASPKSFTLVSLPPHPTPAAPWQVGSPTLWLCWGRECQPHASAGPQPPRVALAGLWGLPRWLLLRADHRRGADCSADCRLHRHHPEKGEAAAELPGVVVQGKQGGGHGPQGWPHGRQTWSCPAVLPPLGVLLGRCSC